MSTTNFPPHDHVRVPMKMSRRTAWILFWLGPVVAFAVFEITGNGTLAAMMGGGLVLVLWYQVVRGLGEV